ncbi:MAG TPA: alpha/beta hydrolase [Chitinophagaceae bacterium]
MKIVRRTLRVTMVLFLVLNAMTAFHAYKFTHFYDDQSLQRIKPEQMSFGDKASALIFGVKYPKSVNAEKPAVPYETVHLYTRDSLKIEGWHIVRDSAKGTVILFHGHGSSKSRILPEAMYFYSLGYNTLLMDFRAHGGSDGNTTTIGYKEAEEVNLAYEYIRGNEKNIILWGISLGASTITKAVNDFNIKPEKIILEMPFGSLHEAVKGRVRVMGLPAQPISSLLTFWGGLEQGFWAFDHNPCEYATKINCEVLLQWGRNDARVTEAEEQCIYQAIPSSKKKLVVYEESGHISLLKNEPEKWKEQVRLFLSPS